MAWQKREVGTTARQGRPSNRTRVRIAVRGFVEANRDTYSETILYVLSAQPRARVGRSGSVLVSVLVSRHCLEQRRRIQHPPPDIGLAELKRTLKHGVGRQ